VTVGDNNDPNGDEGYQWLIDNLGGRWIKTSYNNNIRNRFAGVGFIYDEQRDVFIEPSPYPSWVLDEETYDWQPPTPKPQGTDLIGWRWNEEIIAWEQFDKSVISSS
jgi:hypothetical protein